jgi:CRP-like cAMP-binding protein
MAERPENLGFLDVLSGKSRAALVRAARFQKGRKNQVLVQQGDALSSVFLLQEGLLRVYTLNAEGREATLYLLRAGEVCLLSLNAAFSNGRYPAWVSVESKNAAIALLPGKTVRAMFSSEPAVQEMVLRSLTSTVRELLTHLD